MRRFAPFVGLVLTVAGACGGPQGVGGAGSECFRDDECAFGMVCAVPAGGDARVCTSDVSGLISELPPGASQGGRSTPMGGGATVAGRSNGASGGANGNTGGTTAGTGAGAPSSGGVMSSGGGSVGGTAGAPPGGDEPQAGAAGSAS